MTFVCRGMGFLTAICRFKERLEESNNPLVAKTMDTVGAASDLGARVAKKVTGESETAGWGCSGNTN